VSRASAAAFRGKTRRPDAPKQGAFLPQANDLSAREIIVPLQRKILENHNAMKLLSYLLSRRFRATARSRVFKSFHCLVIAS
jgi:hypothetical protein